MVGRLRSDLSLSSHWTLERIAGGPVTAPLRYGWNSLEDFGMGGDYYVAEDGSDANPGTLALPFATIQHAVDTARAAGGQRTIRVRAGTYRETVDAANWDGTAGAKQRLTGYGAEKPIISGADLVTGWAQCSAADADVIGSTLGVASSPVWKVTIPTPEGSPGYRAHVIEDGAVLPIATDMASVGDHPMSYNSTARYHSADSFGLDGGGDIETITDADVIGGYTAAQLQRMWAAYYRYPNWTSITPVVSASGNTITITPAEAPEGANTSYGLLNALPNLQAGSWGVVDNGDGTSTYYAYPNDEANLAAGMEIMARDIGLDLSAADHVTAEGLEIAHCSSLGLRAGRNGINAESKQQGLTVRQVRLRNIFGNGLSARYADDLRVEHVTVVDPYGGYGLSVTDSTGLNGTGLRIMYCDILRAEQSPIQLYAQSEALVAYCRLRDSGFGAHANLFNNYVGSDQVMWWGMKVENCRGYATWQTSTRNVIGMSYFDNEVTGGDGIRDQNGAGAGTEPVRPSDNWVVNNTLGNREIEMGANGPQGEHLHHTHNNIVSAIQGTDDGVVPVSFDGSHNLLTGTGSTANFDSVFNETTTPGEVFTDPATFDYSLAPGSVAIGWGGKNLDDKLAEWETLYGENLHRDVDGVPFTTLAFVGARVGSYVADTAAPILSAPTASAASSEALDIGVTTDTAIGGIWWVTTASATPPTAEQIAAGQDHTGAAAPSAGIIAATAAGSPLSAQPQGLAPGTLYHVYFSHEDRHGNRAVVATASATTAAPVTGVRVLEDPVRSYTAYSNSRVFNFGAAEPGDMRIAISGRGTGVDVTTYPLPAGWQAPGLTWDGAKWTGPGGNRLLIFVKPVTASEALDSLTLTGGTSQWGTLAFTLRGDVALSVGGFTNDNNGTFSEPATGGLLTVYYRFGSGVSEPDQLAAANGLPFNPAAPFDEGHFFDDMADLYTGNRALLAFALTPHAGGNTVNPVDITTVWPFYSAGRAFVAS